MAKRKKSWRKRLIDEQDDRNMRLRKADKGRSFRGKSLFQCVPCEREVVIAWTDLPSGAHPHCRDCGRPLTLVAAVWNRGVLPKAKLTGIPEAGGRGGQPR